MWQHAHMFILCCACRRQARMRRSPSLCLQMICRPASITCSSSLSSIEHHTRAYIVCECKHIRRSLQPVNETGGPPPSAPCHARCTPWQTWICRVHVHTTRCINICEGYTYATCLWRVCVQRKRMVRRLQIHATWHSLAKRCYRSKLSLRDHISTSLMSYTTHTSHDLPLRFLHWRLPFLPQFLHYIQNIVEL